MNQYDYLHEKTKAISTVGGELLSNIEHCKKTAQEYREQAKKAEEEGRESNFYLEWANNEDNEAEIWAEVEKLFGQNVGRLLCDGDNARFWER